MDKINEKIKKILNKDKKTSNLILIVILLVIVLIATNYIFNSEKETVSKTRETISKNIDTYEASTVETKLSKIISKINGVNAADVMVTYSSTERVIPVYDTKENVDTTNEQDKTSTKKTIEKNVAYEDDGNNKSVIVESKQTAEATGAIIVVSGSITDIVKGEIKEAVAMVTSVPLHKIQIFVN